MVKIEEVIYFLCCKVPNRLYTHYVQGPRIICTSGMHILTHIHSHTPTPTSSSSTIHQLLRIQSHILMTWRDPS